MIEKAKPRETRVAWWLPGAWEFGKWEDNWFMGTNFQLVNKFWGSNVQHGDYS